MKITRKIMIVMLTALVSACGGSNSKHKHDEVSPPSRGKLKAEKEPSEDQKALDLRWRLSDHVDWERYDTRENCHDTHRCEWPAKDDERIDWVIVCDSDERQDVKVHMNVQVEEGIHLSDCATALSRRSLQSYVEEGRKGKAVELGGTKQHCTLVAEDTFGNFINPRPCQGEVPVEITDPQQPVIGLTYDPSARGRNGFLPQRFLLLRDFAWHEGVKVDFSAAAAAQHVQFEC